MFIIQKSRELWGLKPPSPTCQIVSSVYGYASVSIVEGNMFGYIEI